MHVRVAVAPNIQDKLGSLGRDVLGNRRGGLLKEVSAEPTQAGSGNGANRDRLAVVRAGVRIEGLTRKPIKAVDAKGPVGANMSRKDGGE